MYDGGLTWGGIGRRFGPVHVARLSCVLSMCKVCLWGWQVWCSGGP